MPEKKTDMANPLMRQLEEIPGKTTAVSDPEKISGLMEKVMCVQKWL